jgi:hypothetical protein
MIQFDNQEFSKTKFDQIPKSILILLEYLNI